MEFKFTYTQNTSMTDDDPMRITYAFDAAALDEVFSHIKRFLSGAGFYFESDDAIGLISTRDDVEPTT